jgi:hypothetical protein
MWKNTVAIHIILKENKQKIIPKILKNNSLLIIMIIHSAMSVDK